MKQPHRRHEDICIFYNKQPLYQPQMILGAPYNKGGRREQTTGSYGKYNPSLAVSNGARHPYDILFFDEEETDDWFYCKTCEHKADRPFHPTQKLVDLGRYLIRTFTLPGAIVLNNACGCGSFLIAAMREGRRFIGIEKNVGAYHHKWKPVNFVQVARNRIAAEPLPNFLVNL